MTVLSEVQMPSAEVLEAAVAGVAKNTKVNTHLVACRFEDGRGVRWEMLQEDVAALLVAVVEAAAPLLRADLEAENARLREALDAYGRIVQLNRNMEALASTMRVAQTPDWLTQLDREAALIAAIEAPLRAEVERLNTEQEKSSWVGDVLSMVDTALKAHGIDTAPMFFDDEIHRVFQRLATAERVESELRKEKRDGWRMHDAEQDAHAVTQARVARLTEALKEEIASRNAAIMGSAWYALPQEEREVLVSLRLATYNTREAVQKELKAEGPVDMTQRLDAALSEEG